MVRDSAKTAAQFAALKSAPDAIRREFAAISFAERINGLIPNGVMQITAILWHHPDRGRARPDQLPGGAILPAGYLDEVEAGGLEGRNFALVNPDHSEGRGIARRLHAALIAEMGYPAEPLAESGDATAVADEEAAFLAIEHGRAVGLATSKLYSRLILHCRAGADGFHKESCRFEPIPGGGRVRGVELVWVCPRYRRSGVAADLLQAVASAYGLSVCQLAYQLPFSTAGLALVRRMVGDRFMAVGDFAVEIVPVGGESQLLPCDVRTDR